MMLGARTGAWSGGKAYDESMLVLRFELPEAGIVMGLNRVDSGCFIDWGDGEKVVTASGAHVDHTYASAGTFYCHLDKANLRFDPIGGGSPTGIDNMKKYWTGVMSWGRTTSFGSLPFFSTRGIKHIAPIKVEKLVWGTAFSCENLERISFVGTKVCSHGSLFDGSNGLNCELKTDLFGNQYRFEIEFKDMIASSIFPTFSGYQFPFGAGVQTRFVMQDGVIGYRNGSWIVDYF